MKNFPHQINNLIKLFCALEIANNIIEKKQPLSDENFGEQLTRFGVYTYRNKSFTIDQFLLSEQEKPASNRGYLTVARDLRRLFELLNFIKIQDGKIGILQATAKDLLQAESEDIKKEIWRTSFFNLNLPGINNQTSHPYRILLRLVNSFPGIETSKLLLALEAENDSEEEFSRISKLIENEYSVDDIITIIQTTNSMADNAVKLVV